MFDFLRHRHRHRHHKHPDETKPRSDQSSVTTDGTVPSHHYPSAPPSDQSTSLIPTSPGSPSIQSPTLTLPPTIREVYPTTSTTSSDKKEENIGCIDRGRLVHRPHLTNTTSALLRRVPLVRLCWQLEATSWLTEARTFYLVSEVGETLFVQMAYSSSSWLPAQCQVSASYFDARQAQETVAGHTGWKTCSRVKRTRNKKDPQRGQGGHFAETNTHPASKIKLSDSKTSFKAVNAEIRVVGPQLDSSHELAQSELSKEHVVPGFKCLFEGGILKVQLTLETGEEAVCFGDGKLNFGSDATDGYIKMIFTPGVKAVGTLTIDGIDREFRGHGLGLHQIQGIRPNLVATRWNVFLFVSDPPPTSSSRESTFRTTLFLIQICTPSSYGGETVNYGIVHHENQLLALSWDNQLQTFSPSRDPKSGYYLPQEIDLQWRGYTGEGRRFTAECHAQPQTLIDRINLLELLPFVARKILETFFNKPFIYQWIDRTKMTLKVEGEEPQIMEGWILNETTILSEDA